MLVLFGSCKKKAVLRQAFIEELLQNFCVKDLVSVHVHLIILPLCVCQLYQQGRLCQLGGEFCELEVFAKVLRASDKR